MKLLPFLSLFKDFTNANYLAALNRQRDSYHQLNPLATQRPKTTQSTPFEQNGLIEDLLSIDFTEQDALGPWKIKDSVNRGKGGRALTHVGGNGLEWDATQLAMHIEEDNEGSPPDSTFITSPRFTNVKNGWERQYCLSMDVALLSKSTQLSVMLSWYKLSKDFHVTEKLVEIYANEECEAEEPAHPFKREDKKLCIPSEDSQQIELPPFTAKAVNLVLRLVMTAGSDVIIKSFNLVDCSPEPDMSKKPTPKPSGWLANAKAINDPRYGTYWKPEQKVEEVEVITPAPVVIVNAPTQATEAAATMADQNEESLPEEPAEIQLKGANARASSTTTTTTTTKTTYKKAEAVDLPADWGKKKELDSFVKYLSNEEEEIEELIEEEDEIVEIVNFKKDKKSKKTAPEESSSLAASISTCLSALLMLLLAL